jgi:hypothetical protein
VKAVIAALILCTTLAAARADEFTQLAAASTTEIYLYAPALTRETCKALVAADARHVLVFLVQTNCWLLGRLGGVGKGLLTSRILPLLSVITRTHTTYIKQGVRMDWRNRGKNGNYSPPSFVGLLSGRE